MSQTYASTAPANSFRGWLARTWEDPDSRSTLVGVIGVILFYLLLWLVGPYLLRFDHQAPGPQVTAAARQFNIELAPDTFVKPTPKPPPADRFVEANPDAPENTPDQTRNFSDRNQQVAQEKPTPEGKSDRPALEGKKDFESTQIVTGQLNQPLEHNQAVPETVAPPNPKPVEVVRAEQNPLPGFEKKLGENQESVGSNVAKIPNVTQPTQEKVEGAKNVPLIQNATAVQPSVDPLRPQPRPQLASQPNNRPALFAENKFGTSNMGPVAYDAKWSSYGQYLKRLIETVDIQWNEVLRSSGAFPPSGSDVTVTFVLDSAGRIARIVKVESTSNDVGSRACVSAITDRAPYGAWSDDMKAVLGEEQQLTFRFFYQ
jgi:hypothetical protein